MQTLHSFSFYLHLLFGSAALILFWVPMSTAKGSLRHKQFGRYFSRAMYVVAYTGALMALLVLWSPTEIHEFSLPPEQLAKRLERVRVFFGLLLYLSIMLYVSLRHGDLALRSKHNPLAMKKWDHVLANSLLLLGSPILAFQGWTHGQTLALIFACLGLSVAIGNLRYIFSQAQKKNAWLKEHIGAMIASGIAAHTAFFAFGGRNLMGHIGDWQLVFWIAPGVIGGLTIRHFSLKYAAPTHNKA